MGCDGGTIPRRDELVRVAKKPEQKDKEAEMAFRWRHCALTQEKLQEPIVMCGLGRLYSKQSVIEHLLDKEKMPESASHIKTLKDIKDLNMTSNPSYNKDAEKFEGSVDVRNAPYICKLIGLEMSGKFRFIALWGCGCVYSERAFKELKSSVCSLCQKPYTDDDLVILNGNEEDMDHMRTKMETRVAQRKSSKKEKKKTQAKEETATTSSTSGELKVKEENGDTDSPKPGTSAPGASTIPSSKLATDKPLKRSKLDKMGAPEFKKAKDDYSVAEDPKNSEVYKSLFTTHATEQQQDRAHWVTYNPHYN